MDTTTPAAIRRLTAYQLYRSAGRFSEMIDLGNFQVPCWLYGFFMHSLATSVDLNRDFAFIIPRLIVHGITADLRVLMTLARDWMDSDPLLQHAWAHVDNQLPNPIPPPYRALDPQEFANPIIPDSPPQPVVPMDHAHRRQSLLDTLEADSPRTSRFTENLDGPSVYPPIPGDAADLNRDHTRSASPTRGDHPVRRRSPTTASGTPRARPRTFQRAADSMRASLENFAAILRRRSPDHNAPQPANPDAERPRTSAVMEAVHSDLQDNVGLRQTLAPRFPLDPRFEELSQPVMRGITNVLHFPHFEGEIDPELFDLPRPQTSAPQARDNAVSQIPDLHPVDATDVDAWIMAARSDDDGDDNSNPMFIESGDDFTDSEDDGGLLLPVTLSPSPDWVPMAPPARPATSSGRSRVRTDTSSTPVQAPSTPATRPPTRTPSRSSTPLTRTPSTRTMTLRSATASATPLLPPVTGSQLSSTAISDLRGTRPPPGINRRVATTGPNGAGGFTISRVNPTREAIDWFVANWNSGEHLPEVIPGRVFVCQVPGCSFVTESKRSMRNHYQRIHSMNEAQMAAQGAWNIMPSPIVQVNNSDDDNN